MPSQGTNRPTGYGTTSNQHHANGPARKPSLLPAVQGHLGPAGEIPPQGAGGGVHERLGDGIGVNPADLRMLARFPVLRITGPFVGGEDDSEEAVGRFDSPCAVDDVGDSEGLRLYPSGQSPRAAPARLFR